MSNWLEMDFVDLNFVIFYKVLKKYLCGICIVIKEFYNEFIGCLER